MPHTYEYPRPALTVDVVIFTMRAEDLAVLLIKRASPPFKGSWALPGGFVEENEALERAAARELREETGLAGVSLEQLGAFGDPGRDPRGHSVTVAFFTFVVADTPLVAGDDAADAAWHALGDLPIAKPSAIAKSGANGKAAAKGMPKLAFDHALIIERARRRLQDRLIDPSRESAFELVPSRFTLTELQRVYEAVLGRQIDKRNFRARLLARGIVEPVARALRSGKHRPAQLYRWKTQRR